MTSTNEGLFVSEYDLRPEFHILPQTVEQRQAYQHDAVQWEIPSLQEFYDEFLPRADVTVIAETFNARHSRIAVALFTGFSFAARRMSLPCWRVILHGGGLRNEIRI